MDFSRRLRLFLIGVVIGSVVMYFYTFKDRNIYKSPSEVIQDKLTHLPLKITPEATCKIACMQLDTAKLRKQWKNSAIDLSKSLVHEKPCPVYHINLNDSAGHLLTTSCAICEEFTVLQRISSKDSCNCR